MYTYDRVALKKAAKRDLKPVYFKTVLISLIYLVILQLADISIYFGNTAYPHYPLTMSYYAVTWGSAVIVILLSGPLTYGLYHIFTDIIRKNDFDFSTLFVGFKKFGSTVLLGFLQSLFIFLWSLLFIVPGVIKSVAYSMAFFIQRDNPDMTANECLQASIKLTQGHKGKIFGLMLSFVGWYLLASLPLFFIDIANFAYIYVAIIGYIFVLPYYTMALARMYDFLILNYNEEHKTQVAYGEETAVSEVPEVTQTQNTEQQNPFEL